MACTGAEHHVAVVRDHNGALGKRVVEAALVIAVEVVDRAKRIARFPPNELPASHELLRSP